MALEPQIALGVQIPTPENPVQTMTQIESVKALADQRQALAEQRKQQAQKLVEDAQNRAAINEFLSQANGDPMVAGDIATKMGKGEIGQQLYAQATAHRQKIAEAMKSENDLSQAHLDMALKIASTMADSPAHYDAGRQAMAGVIGDDPNLKQWFQSTVPEHPDPAQIPYIVNSLTKVGEDAKTRASQQATNVENFLKGDYNKSLSSQLLSVPKEQRAQVLTVAAQMAPSTSVRNALLQQFAPILADDDAIAKAGKTPHEQAEESVAKAKADEDAKNKAAELKIQQQNADANTFRAHNPASAATTPVDPEVVAGYVRQVKNGSLPLQNIPAHAKDAVVKSLEASGENVTQLTSQGKQMKETATTLLPMIDKVESLAKQLDQQGLMGTLGGRARNIAGVESAAADIQGLNPEQRKLIGEFASAGGLLITGIARAHGGARAGGSPQMIEHLSKLMDAKDKDINTFLGNLQGERDFMNAYANMGPSGNTSSQAPADYRMVNGKLVKVGGS